MYSKIDNRNNPSRHTLDSSLLAVSKPMAAKSRSIYLMLSLYFTISVQSAKPYYLHNNEEKNAGKGALKNVTIIFLIPVIDIHLIYYKI